MTQEPSVAPKERVNIVYRPAVGEAQHEVELPLKMLVLGDFAGRKGEAPLDVRDPVGIDKDNFDEVLKGHSARLQCRVPNRLVEGGGDLEVSLQFQSLKDFEPESIVGQVPELVRLLELREALRALKGPLCNVPGFRKKIQELISDEASRQKLLTEVASKP